VRNADALGGFFSLAFRHPLKSLTTSGVKNRAGLEARFDLSENIDCELFH
jgi:hypothetical protein